MCIFPLFICIVLCYHVCILLLTLWVLYFLSDVMCYLWIAHILLPSSLLCSMRGRISRGRRHCISRISHNNYYYIYSSFIYFIPRVVCSSFIYFTPRVPTWPVSVYKGSFPPSFVPAGPLRLTPAHFTLRSAMVHPSHTSPSLLISLYCCVNAFPSKH